VSTKQPCQISSGYKCGTNEGRGNGIHLRWERALEDYSDVADHRQNHNHDEFTSFWKFRYFSEERDATRNFILAEELESLVFNFRFWIEQPTTDGDRRILVKSGNLDFAVRRTLVVSGLKRIIFQFHRTASEVIWYLDESGSRITWGFVPNLWPQGTVHRMDNWGWQIHNKNMVLRTIDQVSSPLFLEPSDFETTKLAADDSEVVISCGKIC
ncbi:hypothetical protein ACHAXA_001163, partial [Cyclostephanos tholiformis]